MASLAERWQSLSDRTYPAEVRGKVINGVNLDQIETFATMSMDTLLRAKTLDGKQVRVLLYCSRELSWAMPALAGETRDYFSEMESLVGVALDEVAHEPFHFVNVTGQELFRLLSRRADERLLGKAPNERLELLLGAGLVMLAETLSGPIEAAADRKQLADRMVDLCAKWLRTLLEPATEKK